VVTGLTGTFRRQSKPASVSATDIMKLATELIQMLGERSTSYANYQALKARQRGDQLHQKVWRWIAGATVEILRSELPEVSAEALPQAPAERHSVSPGS
jgi:hypothetical protein